MSNKYFSFKHFTVYHDRCAMKVGTDGVLIGSWAAGGTNILDIGTGTGLIALMMAQRFPSATINAIEIDNAACEQAHNNVRLSGYEKRINIFHISLQDYAERCKTLGKVFDSIVSNPPFYTEDTLCPDTKRDTARHTSTLKYNELFRCVSGIISDNGTFSLITPYDAKDKVMFEACISGMHLVKECNIRTTPKKTAKRTLLVFAKKYTSDVMTEDKCLMDADGNKSEWYRNITSEFYL